MNPLVKIQMKVVWLGWLILFGITVIAALLDSDVMLMLVSAITITSVMSWPLSTGGLNDFGFAISSGISRKQIIDSQHTLLLVFAAVGVVAALITAPVSAALGKDAVTTLCICAVFPLCMLVSGAIAVRLTLKNPGHIRDNMKDSIIFMLKCFFPAIIPYILCKVSSEVNIGLIAIPIVLVAVFFLFMYRNCLKTMMTVDC